MNRLMAAVLAGAIIGTIGARSYGGDWETDFEKASAAAGESGMYMLLDFSGSDWCGWCIKLDKEVFSKSEFKKFAEKNLVCVLVDFPRGKKQDDALKAQNRALAKKYEIEGYPTVIILAPDGSLAGRTGYQPGGPEKYIEHLKEIIDQHKREHPGAGAPEAKASVKPAPEAKALIKPAPTAKDLVKPAPEAGK